MEGCAGGKARALNLQCAGRDVDDLGLSKGTALGLKALLESLRAPVHTGGAPAPSPAPLHGETDWRIAAPAPAPPAPVQVCHVHTSRTYPYTLFSLASGSIFGGCIDSASGTGSKGSGSL